VSQALPRSTGPVPTAPPSIWRKRLPTLGVVLLLGLAAWLLIGAFTTADTSITTNYPEGLDRVDPIPKAQTVPSQSTILVDLAFGYDAELYLNGTYIPRDQLNRASIEQTGVFSYTPSEGAIYRLLPGSLVTAKVVFWPTTGSQTEDGQTFEWTFSVT
jgi:hypothetical protein